MLLLLLLLFVPIHMVVVVFTAVPLAMASHPFLALCDLSSRTRTEFEHCHSSTSEQRLHSGGTWFASFFRFVR